MPSTLPPYPENLSPEAPLSRISLSLLLSHDPDTEAELVAICQSHGFFYLDLTAHPLGKSFLEDADALQALAEEAFKLPPETKNAISFQKTKSLFGFKPSGQIASADPHQRKDRGEFWNISKDDILAINPDRRNIPYPAPFPAHQALLHRFTHTAHGIGITVLDLLARRALAIPPAHLAARHRITACSGDHIRLTWAPGDSVPGGSEAQDEARIQITTPPHTDFGTVTLLFNWAGGLQIANAQQQQQQTTPGAGAGAGPEEWEWVRPLPGHAICNLGDAMVEFSGGRVRSGRHRVVAAPGAQAQAERYSVVYFVRPEDEVYMEDLTQVAGEGGGNGADGQGVNGMRFVQADGLQKEQKRWKAKDWIVERAATLGNRFDGKAERKE